MQKTSEEILQSLKTNIAYENPEIDLTAGNVVTDLGVDAFSNELAAIYTEQDRIRNVYLLNASSFTDAEADSQAASYGLVRLEATKATGEVVFCASTLPEAGQFFTIPIGTTVSTSGGSSDAKTYTVTTEGIIDSSTPLNPNTNYYECTVNVQASVAGTTGNVGPGVINQILGSVAGITTVYNQNSLTNGTEQETTAELVERIKLRLRGFVYGTKASYLSKVYEDPRITDAVIVDPDSEFSVRGPGTIDVYILGTEAATYEQTVTSGSASTVYLTKVPYINDGSAHVILEGGTTITTGFTIVSDESSIYAGSSASKDKLVWDADVYSSTIANTNSYTIVYKYNKLINDLQETFDSDTYKIITSDVLVRKTSVLLVGMDFDIVTKSGYDTSTVKNNVVYAIQQYVNNFKLNESLRQSDIIGIVEGISGVDYVKLPMRKFNELNKTGVTDVYASPLEYIRINATDLQIG